MAEKLTGSCIPEASIELVPDDVNSIVPAGYNEVLDLNTEEVDLGISESIGIPTTGECAECPPGMVLKCCTDTDIDIPPGTPVLFDCKKILIGNNVYFSDIEDYNGYVYAGIMSAGIARIDKETKAYISTDNIDDSFIPEGYYKISQSHIVKWVIWNEKIITSYFISDNPSDSRANGKFAILDLDLKFLEWWDWPTVYKIPVSLDRNNTSKWSVFENTVWTTIGRVTDKGNSYYSLLMGYDYYGNVVYRKEAPNIDFSLFVQRIEKLGNNYIISAHIGDALRITDNIDNFDTAPKLVLSDLNGTGFNSLGARMIKYTTTTGLERMIITGSPSNVGDNADQVGFWVIDDQGNELAYIRQPMNPISECMGGGTVSDGEERFGNDYSAIYVFGDNIIVGASGNTCRTGDVYIYDAITFKMKMSIGKSDLMPEAGDQIGVSVFMDKNEVWMFSKHATQPRYIKYCKNKW